VLHSREFSQSPQLSAFLRFIVLQTLAGRADSIKGYAIATVALGRPDTFDPQQDPIVRVQAGRLRRALASFYDHDGAKDPLRIELDRGTYVPKFVRNTPAPGLETIATTRGDDGDAGRAVAQMQAQEAANAAFTTPQRVPKLRWPAASAAGVLGLLAIWLGASILLNNGPSTPSPAVAANVDTALSEFVMPVLTVAQSDVAAAPAAEPADVNGFIERLREAIARFDDVLVVRETSDDDGVVTATKSGLPDLRYQLLVRITPAAPGTQRVNVRLLHVQSRTVIWSREFDDVPLDAAGASTRSKIVRSVATTVAQPYGVIFSHAGNLMPAEVRARSRFGCLVASFNYWRTNDPQSHLEIRACLEAETRRPGQAAAAYAQLTYVHLEEFRLGYNPLPGNALDRALASAMKAVELAPSSARAQEALLAAHFSRREEPEAWTAMSRALQLNPYDTDILADAGARNIQTGRFAEGLALIYEATQYNTAPPIWATTYKVIGHLALHQEDQAIRISNAVPDTSYALAIIARLATAAMARDTARWDAARSRLQVLYPRVAGDVAGYLDRLVFTPELRDRLAKLSAERPTPAN
jgi:Tfp pilus assembly protein PilF